jgi:hypothetical protein
MVRTRINFIEAYIYILDMSLDSLHPMWHVYLESTETVHTTRIKIPIISVTDKLSEFIALK